MGSVAIYIAAIVAANLSVAAFGPAVSPINAFLLIGLDLSLRDKLHDRWAGSALWPRMLGMIAAAGIVSYALNPAAGKIAVASVVAFCLAALADAIAYHALKRKRWAIRSNGSNVAGAAVDSLTFPTLAFGAIMPEIIALQFAAKVAGGAMWSWIIASWRNVVKAKPLA